LASQAEDTRIGRRNFLIETATKQEDPQNDDENISVPVVYNR
jgi:hypothetical protein